MARFAWPLVAVLLLAVGYWDLARGGITLGALALTVAYVVAIPAAIWWPVRGRTAIAEPRPPYLAAAVTGAAILALYLLTLAPSTALWDASEYIAASHMLGIPHPPGNPMFVLLGRTFALLPIAPGVAARVNVMSALATSVAAAMWFLVAHRVLRAWFPARWQQLGGAAVSALLGATAFTVWNQSVVTEKVYPVALAGIAVVSWLAVRWLDAPDGPRADRLLLLCAYLLGLGYANQMAGVIPAPGLALAVIACRPRTLLRWRLILAGLALAVVGLTPFATQPIRSAYNPAINEGEPTACRAGLAWDCTFSQGTWDAFKYNFDRKQYGKPPLMERQAPFTGQVGMWWQYFRWQWHRDLFAQRQGLQTVLAATFLVLGLLGGWAHWKRHRASWWYVAPLVFLLSLGLVYYMNFKYGATQAPGLGDAVPREVRDRDYFFMWSFSTWGLWAGLGLAWLWEAIAGRVDARTRAPNRTLAAVATAVVLLLALVPLASNWTSASRRGDHTAIAFAKDLLNSVEPYGVIVTGGDNDTFPLWYAQEVEGVRKDVTVYLLELLNTDWYVRGLIRRPIHAYDAAKGPAIYRNTAWRKPTTPVLHMTLQEADAVPPYSPITQPMTFRAHGMTGVIDPRNLPNDGAGTSFLTRGDILFLRMIADVGDERPIYVSRTAGDVARQLGMGEHVVVQGLVRRLMPTPPAGAMPMEGGAHFDVARTRTLFEQVYEGPAAVVRRGTWVDFPSVSIPMVYAFTGAELQSALEARGDTAAARRVGDTVRAIGRAVRQEGVTERLVGR